MRVLSSQFLTMRLCNTLTSPCIDRVAWVIGWGLVLEYTVGGSAVARGISPNLVCPLKSVYCLNFLLIASTKGGVPIKRLFFCTRVGSLHLPRECGVANVGSYFLEGFP